MIIKYLVYLKKLNIVFLMIFILSSCTQSNKDFKSIYYKKLDISVLEKKHQLTQYFDLIGAQLSSITSDGPLIDVFNKLNMIFLSQKNKTKLFGITESFQELENIIVDSYLNRFMVFDDLLFINLEGDVFYTLKKGEPLMKNIFSSEYKDTNLSKSLKENPLSQAIDFDIFSPGDPSAFFVYPVMKDSIIIGWCAFKFLSDNLDMLFSSEHNIGITGEVFLVNEDSYMLTNSSFTPESSTLKLHLSDENIKYKFKAKKGHKEITDYRGYKTITSFEVCTIFNLNWLLVAKMDCAEILNEKYMSDSKSNYNIIRSRILKQENIYLKEKPVIYPTNEVNLDQIKRVSITGSLYTHGVSSCTAVLITLPGEFSYLAHISAYDLIYGGINTDLLGNMLKRIYKFEIPDNKIREVEIYIITPEIRFSEDILSILIQNKIMLSQIHILKNNDAQYANIYHKLESNETFVEWKLYDYEETVFQNIKSVPKVSEYLEL